MSQPTDPSSANPYEPSSANPPAADATLVPATFEDQLGVLFDRGRNGANWFFWVAGLSAINSVIALAGGDLSFVLGLSATMIADAIAADIAKQEATSVPLFVAGCFDAVVLSLVVLCGWLSRKRILLVYGLGMVLYLLDGLILLLVLDILSIAIHAFALWGMWAGFTAYRQLNAIERQIASGAWESAPATPPAS